MKLFILIFLLWPGTLVAQSCTRELNDLKKEVKEKEKQCKKENSVANKKKEYDKELKVIESNYRSKFVKISQEQALAIQKLKAKYGVK